MLSRMVVVICGSLAFSSVAQAQEPVSMENGETAQTAMASGQCTTRRPSIFAGRARGMDCSVPGQPRCKVSRPSIFSGGGGSQECVLETQAASGPVYRPSIFAGRPSSRVAQAPAPSYVDQPSATAPTYGAVQTASPVAAPKPKVRRHTIFTGGRRRED